MGRRPRHAQPLRGPGRGLARRKVALLNECFPTQVGRDWWDDELFLGLMRMRGVESRAQYAEGFFATKVLLDLTGRDVP